MMLTPFGLLRFSCSFLVECFVKTRRGGRRRHRSGGHSDSDEEEDEGMSRPVNIAAAAKGVIAKMKIRIRPPKPMTKPCLISFLTFFTHPRKPNPAATVAAPEVSFVKESDVRTRRSLNKSVGSFSVPRRSLERRTSGGSLSFDDCSHYPSDVSSVDEFEEMGSEFSPRMSADFLNHHRGLNPTFYGSEFSDDDADEDEGEMPRGVMPLRKIDSVVEKDAQLKENVFAQRSQQLLLNPAYGSKSMELHDESTTDSGDMEIRPETKLKTLKSAVKGGCRAEPTSTVLVGLEYIGHTTINPTYGDCSDPLDASDIDEVGTPISNGHDIPPSPFLAPEDVHHPYHLENLDQFRMAATPRSLPLLSFRGLLDSGNSQNMGTLTWRNMAYSEESDDDLEATEMAADLQTKWKETLHDDTVDDVTSPPAYIGSPSCSSSSCTADSTILEDIHLKPPPPTKTSPEIHRTMRTAHQTVKHRIPEAIVTPVRSIPLDGFEDIDIKCHSTIKTKPSEPSKRSSTDKGGSFHLFTYGLKNTRWALRSLTLMLDRVDIFSGSGDKQK